MGKVIEAPECEIGYTRAQLERIMGDRFDEFNKWMFGQTGGICDGRSYNHERGEYEPSGCGPHGLAVYAWDVHRFLDGRPVID